MPVELTREQEQPTENLPLEEEWTPELPPTDLIFDDGEPLESNRHRIAMNALIEAVTLAYQGREDYFTGGNMFVYYSVEQARNRDFKGPDFFVTLNVDGTKERQGWVVWQEHGRYPDVIVELMSPSTAAVDKGKKKLLYEQTFKTGHYFVYDPFVPESLQGWKLSEKFRYEEITPDERGWLWCDSLGLWLGTWSGTILRETATWLRFYDAAGNLVKLSFELAEEERAIAQQQRERADRAQERAVLAESNLKLEQERAEKLAARLKELGIDPDM